MNKIIFAVLFWVSICFGQGYEFLYSPVRGSTQSFSMGGCFTATDCGVESLLGNPAGLAGMSKSEMLLNGRMTVMGDIGYNDDFYIKQGYKEYDVNYEFNFKPYTIGFAFPLRLPNSNFNITGALGYRCYYDMSYSQDREIVYSHSQETKSTSTYKSKGLLNVLSIGIGIQLSPQINIGILFNVPMFSRRETLIESDTAINSGISGMRNDISGSGFFQLGGLVHVHPRLSLGATYYMNHKLNYHDYETRSENENDYSPADNDEIEFQYPNFWSTGIQYRVFDNLMLTTEIQSFPWNDYKTNSVGYGFYQTGKDVHAGLEYGRDFKLRLGYYTNKLPINDDGPDFVEKYGFSGGAGFMKGNVRCDIATVSRTLAHTLTARTIFNPEGIGEYEYKTHELLIYASVIYTFDFGLGK